MLELDIICEDDMPEEEWQHRVKGLLKAELKRRGFSYRELATRLAEIGVRDNEKNINNKISRGSFSAVFLIQCLSVIGCKRLDIE